MPVSGHRVAPKPGSPEGTGAVPERVRTAFGLLERFAPAPGAWWAYRRWCTPPDQSPTLRLPPGLTPGRRLEVTWSGHTVVGESWGEGPAVYLVHGWGGWRGHLAVFVQPLVDAGHRVIAFDLPSHNDSGPGDQGWGRTTIVECARALRAVVEATAPRARAVIAHSLGAKAAALATAWGMPVERLVFLAPMGDFALYLDRFTSQHGFGPRIRTGLHRRLDRRLGTPLFHTDVSHLATQIEHPPPLLVIHDPDDPDTPYAGSEVIARAWPGSTLMSTGGLGPLAHYRILRNPRAINASVDFLGPADRDFLIPSDGAGANPSGS
jgi:pimeloyl-ACP methyl ester carboxylesterase